MSRLLAFAHEIYLVPMHLPCCAQVMHKAPVKEAKQVEHIVSERQVIGEAAHPLCVRLRGSYQDSTSLYLLQDWIPGTHAHDFAAAVQLSMLHRIGTWAAGQCDRGQTPLPAFGITLTSPELPRWSEAACQRSKCIQSRPPCHRLQAASCSTTSTWRAPSARPPHDSMPLASWPRWPACTPAAYCTEISSQVLCSMSHECSARAQNTTERVCQRT